jgi:hypothetical protein
MHASLQLLLDGFQFRLHALSQRLPQDGESPFPRPPTDVGETQKMENLRLAFSTLGSVFRRKASKLDQAGFVRMQFQVELVKSGC